LAAHCLREVLDEPCTIARSETTEML
jgi:hypothetical protein